MLRQIAKDGINVSTVLVGAQAHNQLLIDLASWGKGRFYSVVDRYNLPEIILKQPSTMKLPAYKTGTFGVQTPRRRGLVERHRSASLPALDGYVETTARDGAETLMEIEGSERSAAGDVAVRPRPRHGAHDRTGGRGHERLGRTGATTADCSRASSRARPTTRDCSTTTSSAHRPRARRHRAARQPRLDALSGSGGDRRRAGSESRCAFRRTAPGQFMASVAVDPSRACAAGRDGAQSRPRRARAGSRRA